jgi:hypothetical protein
MCNQHRAPGLSEPEVSELMRFIDIHMRIRTDIGEVFQIPCHFSHVPDLAAQEIARQSSLTERANGLYDMDGDYSFSMRGAFQLLAPIKIRCSDRLSPFTISSQRRKVVFASFLFFSY